jgi:hypothetical protein
MDREYNNSRSINIIANIEERVRTAAKAIVYISCDLDTVGYL